MLYNAQPSSKGINQNLPVSTKTRIIISNSLSLNKVSLKSIMHKFQFVGEVLVLKFTLIGYRDDLLVFKLKIKHTNAKSTFFGNKLCLNQDKAQTYENRMALEKYNPWKPCTRCKLCFITFNLTERFWLIVIPYTTQHWPGNVYLHYPPDAWLMYIYMGILICLLPMPMFSVALVCLFVTMFVC